MAPKKRIGKKKPTKAKGKPSSNTVHKKKLKKALLSKGSTKKNTKKKAPRTKAQGHPPATTPQKYQKNNSNKRGPGRPSKLDYDEEAFLRNVPDHLRNFVWRPGQSGNPKGRPKGKVGLTDRLRSLLLTPIEGRSVDKDRKGKKAPQLVADELMGLAVQAARKGDYRFFQHIYERIEGKVPEHLVIEAAKQMIAQEAEALAMRFVKLATEVADVMFGVTKAQEYGEKLGASIKDMFEVSDVGSRAG